MNISTGPHKITEGWVTFLRFNCKEGTIDKWMGSSNTNPNRSEKPPLQSSNFSTYYRLNGTGQWVRSTEFFGLFNALVSREALDSFKADELWNRCRKIVQRVAC